jgi:hypothetical protein
MKTVKQLPPRSKVRPSDRWDLGSLFPDDAAWEKAFTRWEKQIAGYAESQGKLARDAATLAAGLCRTSPEHVLWGQIPPGVRTDDHAEMTIRGGLCGGDPRHGRFRGSRQTQAR